MESLGLCAIAFAACYLATRRSLATGMMVLLTIGYFYGIVRANVPQALSHFIFDVGVGGLYLAQFTTRKLTSEQRRWMAHLKPWLVMLIGLPLLLFFIPQQNPMVQLVGLRKAVWFLPFMLIGAVMEDDDYYKLAIWLALLNMVAFAFAFMEYTTSIERFFPHNQMTKTIYVRDVMGATHYRIPSTFVSAAGFGAAMVISMPMLIGASVQRHRRAWYGWLLFGALGVSVVGVFMAASRTQAMLMMAVGAATFLQRRMKAIQWLGFVAVMALVGWIVMTNPRMQRFTTLQDTSYDQKRISKTVTPEMINEIFEHPLGVGLGAAGTSIPYFLQGEVSDPIFVENEYGWIALEQGVLGLVLWIAFLVWVFARLPSDKRDPWFLGRRLAWVAGAAYFGTAFLGTGLFSAVPLTAVLLLYVGWIVSVRSPVRSSVPIQAHRQDAPRLAPVRRYGW